MGRLACTLLLMLLAASLATSQNQNSPLRFEVASIKPAERTGPCNIGPGITEFSCKATVNTMIVFAFHLASYQYTFSPAEGPRYKLIAKIPAAVSAEISKGTKDGYEVCMDMLRNLLADRFQLAYHFKQKQLDEYSLVAGKGGPKVTVSPAESLPDNDLSLAPAVPKKDTWYGIAAPIVKGEVSYRRDFAGTVYLASTGATIDQFAAVAKVFLAGVPVVDATELRGRYDFQLTFSASRYESGLKSADNIHAPDIKSAIRSQLGLDLVKKRALLNTFVVDHLEKPSI